MFPRYHINKIQGSQSTPILIAAIKLAGRFLAASLLPPFLQHMVIWISKVTIAYGIAQVYCILLSGFPTCANSKTQGKKYGCCTDSTTDQVVNPYADPRRVYCQHYDDFGSQRFHIYARGWATDDNSDRLHHEESGCGSILKWHWDATTATVADPKMGNFQAEYVASFPLPYIPLHGCVERAIKSAGGPDTQCRKL